MPPAKAKKSANGTSAANGKAPASTSGTATPLSSTDKKDTSEQLSSLTSGKPDKKLHDAEQEQIKAEIDAIQLKLNAVRDKIGLASKAGPENDRRNALRAELDGLRDQQSSNKNSRSRILEQSKALQESISKKVKDLQAAKAKIHFKSVAEVDAHIQHLEKQVESGSMKLADEKRALQEISTTKRCRRTVEGFQAEQDLIDADRQRFEEIKAQLEDPNLKALSNRYEAIRAELDELKKQSDEAYAGRSKLFEERDGYQSQLRVLYDKKRETVQRFREANDRYWEKVNEDRARRAERHRAQRAAELLQKKQETAQRLREEAEIPAFQAHIEDCQTLIDYFSGKSTGVIAYKSAELTPKTELAGVPKLDIRQVEDIPEGLVARKKKGDQDEAYFISSKGKNKNKKGTNSTQTNASSPSPTSSSSLNVPLPTLSALLAFSIPPPASSADVTRVIEDLNTKKAWYEANQTRVTNENISKAEAEIQRLNSKVESEDALSEGTAETPPEPISTALVDDPLSKDISTAAVDITQEAQD